MIDKYKALPVQAKASLCFLLCSFLQRGISTITTPIFTRIMSTADYGQYSVFNSWMGIVAIFTTLNLSYGVYTQGLIKFDKESKVFSSALQGLSSLMILVWFAIYLFTRSFWNRVFSLTTVQMLAMFLMMWTSAVFNLWAAEQRVQYKYRALVAITLGVSAAKPLLGVILVSLAEDKVTARIWGLAIVELLGYSVLFWIQMLRGKKFFSAKFWKYAIGFNLPLIPHYLSQTLLNSADRIMIEDLVGVDEAGIYSLAYSIALIMTLFNTALTSTINPWIYQKIRDRKIEELANVAYMTLVIIAGVNLLLIALAPEVVRFFAPASYYEAIYVIPPVAMSVYFMFSYDLFAKFAFYYEKTKFIMVASVVGAVLNVVLNYLFIPRYGYRAAGYTTLGCYIIYSICHYVFMNKVCDSFCDGIRPYEWKKIGKISGLFLVLGLGMLFTYEHNVLRYAVIASGCVVVFLMRKRLINEVQKLLRMKKGVAL